MARKTTRARKIALTPGQKAAATKRAAGTLSEIALKAAATRRANIAKRRKTARKAPRKARKSA